MMYQWRSPTIPLHSLKQILFPTLAFTPGPFPEVLPLHVVHPLNQSSLPSTISPSWSLLLGVGLIIALQTAIIFALWWNIRRRQAVEATLRESDARYQATLSALPDIVFRFNPTHDFVGVNLDDDSRLLMSPVAFLGHNIRDVLPPALAKQTAQKIDEAFQTGQIIVYEYALNVQGETHTYESRLATSAADEVVAIVRDITERKNTEAQLQHQARLLQEVSDAVIVTDADFRIMSWNQAAENLYGWARHDAIGEQMGSLVPTRYARVDEATVLNEFARHGCWEGEVIQQKKDGQVFYAHSVVTALYNTEGNINGAIGINRDISAYKQAEAEIDHLNRVLRAIRSVNQVIAREKNRDYLLQDTCDSLVASQGYYNAWIALFDDQGNLVVTAQADMDPEFMAVQANMAACKLPDCGQQALLHDEVVVISTPALTCHNCPLANHYADRGAMSVRLAHGDNVYGFLTVSTPNHFLNTQEEQDLLREVAVDLGLALHNLEVSAQIHRLNHIFTTIPHPLSFVSKDYRYLTVNDSYSTYFDTPKSKIVGRSVADFMGPALFENETRPQLDRCLRGETVRYQIQVNFPHLGHRWMEMEYYPYRDERGQIAGVVSYGLDITDRKKAEDTLNTILNSINDAVIATDIDDRIVGLNPVAIQITGWSEADVLGQPLAQVICITNEKTGSLITLPTAHAMQQPMRLEPHGHIVLASQDGHHIPIAMHVAPMLDPRRNAIGLVFTFRDQTEERLNQGMTSIRLNLIDFAGQHPLHEVLTRALDEISAFMDSPIAFYHFVEPDEETLSLQQWSTRTLRDFCQANESDLHYPVAQAGVWADCVRTGKPLIHNDYATLPHRKGLPPGHAIIERELVVPVIRNGKVVAILGIGNKAEDYTEQDMEIVTYLADVTWEIVRQKRAEEELHRTEQRYRSLIENAPDGIILIGADGRFKFSSPSARRMFGYSEEALHQLELVTLTHPDEQDIVTNLMRSIMRGEVEGQPTIEYRFATQTGSWRWISSTFSNALGEAGVEGIVINFRDVTERRQAEDTLRLLNRAIEQSPVSVVITDTDSKIQYVNPKFSQVTGYSSEEVIGRNPSILNAQNQSRKFYQQLWETLTSGREWRGEFHNRKKNGDLFWELASISPVTNRKGIVTHYVAVKEDITDRKHLEAEASEQYEQSMIYAENLRAEIAVRQETEQRLQALLIENHQLLSAIPLFLIAIEHNGRIRRWNEPAETIFQLKAAQVEGRTLHEVPIELDWATLEAGFARCRNTNAVIHINDLQFCLPDRGEGFLKLSITPFGGNKTERPGFLILGEEVTERRVMENQLVQSQKLRAIGRLAAGIAHEINSPTQFIGDNVGFVQSAFAKLSQVFEAYQNLLQAAKGGSVTNDLIDAAEQVATHVDLAYLLDEVPFAIEDAQEGVQRVSKIVQAMKEFSHPGIDEKVPVNINKTIESTITVARNEWKYVADVETHFDPNLPPVPCLPGEFNQTILNLLVNAAHAIADVVDHESGQKGIISVSTHPNSDYAEVRIADTGSGIPEAIQTRIFDPFFTTKEAGRGTGQGLSIAHSVIVEKHGGTLDFETTPGQGTTFIIRLPLTLETKIPHV